LLHDSKMKQRTPKSGHAIAEKEVRPKYLRVDQAELMSGVSRWTWRRWAYTSKIASVKAGKRLLIPIAEFDRVMSEGYRPALETAGAVRV
jgi:hypothetical protein